MFGEQRSDPSMSAEGPPRGASSAPPAGSAAANRAPASTGLIAAARLRGTDVRLAAAARFILDFLARAKKEEI